MAFLTGDPRLRRPMIASVLGRLSLAQKRISSPGPSHRFLVQKRRLSEYRPNCGRPTRHDAGSVRQGQPCRHGQEGWADDYEPGSSQFPTRFANRPRGTRSALSHLARVVGSTRRYRAAILCVQPRVCRPFLQAQGDALLNSILCGWRVSDESVERRNAADVGLWCPSSQLDNMLSLGVSI